MTVQNDERLTELLGAAAPGNEVPERSAGLVAGPRDDDARRSDARSGLPQSLRRLSARRRLQIASAAASAAVVLIAALVSAGGSGSRSAGTAAGTPDSASSVAADVPAAGAPVPAAGGVRNGATAVPPDGARVVKTGSLSLLVDNGQVTPVLTATQKVIASLQGYVAASSTQELGVSPSGTVTFRIPVANFERALTLLRGLHVTVRDAQASGRDVTAQYADTAAQVDSLKAARGRFLMILGQARTIGETLTVQQRVDDVQGQIDRLEGQRRLLVDQSDLATLTVTVAEKDDLIAVQPAPRQGGLSRAFHDAVHGFTSGAEALLARSGRALLVLLVLGALAVVLRLGWRVARRRLV